MNWKAIALVCFGGLVLTLGILLPLIFPILFEAKLNEKLVISPGAPVMDSFSKTPIPIYFQVYFFNVTNSEDILDGDKPILDQVGPYTYRQERVKQDITWNHDEGTVFFREQKHYFFEPDMSSGPEDDLVTTINPVFMTLASKGDSLNFILRSAISMYTWSFVFEPFMTHPVGELTFSGYNDDVIADLYTKTDKPKYKDGKAGYFYGKNGTVDEGMDIFSGELGMHNYQHIHKWHNLTELPFWRDQANNMLNGTAGSQFSRPIDLSKPLFMFASDLCRSIYLRYEKDVQHGPLTLHRFAITPEVLASSVENEGFCTDEFTCRDSMIDVSVCRDGAPIVMSTPHYYLGNASDLQMVEGLKPSKEEHETYLDIEPNTGVTMRAAKRMQVNVAFRPSAALSDLDYAEPIIFPVLWVNESAVVPLARVEALAKTLTGPKQMANYLAAGLILVGVLLLLLGAILHCCTSKKKQQITKPQTDVSMNLLTQKNGNEKA